MYALFLVQTRGDCTKQTALEFRNLNDYDRLQVMELETAVQVSTNQMKRQEEENKRLQEAVENGQATIRSLEAELSEHKRKYTDLEGQVR